jgi:hypothetical protein
MELADVKRFCQDHFSDGLVTIVGSGLSVAEGISGMGALAKHLLKQVPARIDSSSTANWKEISKALSSGIDLETALLSHAPTDQVEAAIVALTADLILADEAKVLGEVLNNGRHLRFTKLLKHMLKPNSGIPIITTNYDRLIEVAVECEGLGIDSLFTGHHIAKHDPVGSRNRLCRSIKQQGKTVVRAFCDHAVVLKPHGSLDWYRKGTEPVRCTFPIDAPRLIITPGLNKFRGGYDQPFDAHRERANKEIDGAQRFLILGYGFNDEHLQTHLEQQLLRGLPALLITHSPSPKALQLISKCPSLTAIVSDTAGAGAMVHHSGDTQFFSGANLWDLEVFVNEVFE